MRVPIVVYGLLYLVVEMVGAQLAEVQWRALTPLLVATAVTDALLVVSVLAAALVTADLTKHRWRPAVHDWLHERAHPHTRWWGAHHPPAVEVIGVRSWRPAPLALTAAPPPPPPGYGPRPAGGHAFPEEPGRLL